MQRYLQLVNHLRTKGPLAIAFSGGVDSTLLAKAAHDALGEQSLAITINGPMQFRQELAEARTLAHQIGIHQIELRLDWAQLAALHTNPPDRCYLCKQTLLTRCRLHLASSAGAPAPSWNLADGSTADDLQAHRPGRRALEELNVASPLAELGFSKAEIRATSRQLGLSTWDKQAQSCLLTRFPHDVLIIPEELRRVEACEEKIRSLGFKQVRVRALGHKARLEFTPDALSVAQRPELQKTITELCKTAGFTAVELDPLGYRSGSMD